MILTRVMLGLVIVLAPACFGQVNQTGDEEIAETRKLDGESLSLIFKDDFENGRGQWASTDDKNWGLQPRGNSSKGKSSKGKSSKENSGQVLGLLSRKSNYQPPVRSPHNLALIKTHEFEDFVLELEVRNSKDTGAHRDCCVFFGYQGPQKFYYVHLGHKPDPASGQIMIVNEKPRAALTKNEAKLVNWTGDWHKVKVTRSSKSGEIRVYFDDMTKPYLTCKDKTFARGQIGIGSFDDINQFDNVRIYGN